MHWIFHDQEKGFQRTWKIGAKRSLSLRLAGRDVDTHCLWRQSRHTDFGNDGDFEREATTNCLAHWKNPVMTNWA